MFDPTNVSATDEAQSPRASIDSVLRLFSNEPTPRELEHILLEDELNRQRDLPNDGRSLTVLTQLEEFCSVYTGSTMERDPFVRLSGILMWALMQDEKARGFERVEKTLSFNDKDGYYMMDPDALSMTSIELNPTRPRAPAPRSTPMYRPIRAPSEPEGSFLQNTKKRWIKLLGLQPE